MNNLFKHYFVSAKQMKRMKSYIIPGVVVKISSSSMSKDRSMSIVSPLPLCLLQIFSRGYFLQRFSRGDLGICVGGRATSRHLPSESCEHSVPRTLFKPNPLSQKIVPFLNTSPLVQVLTFSSNGLHSKQSLSSFWKQASLRHII